MTDQVLLTMSTALAGDVQIGSDDAWDTLVRTVREKVPADLDAARKHPGSTTWADLLAQHIQVAARKDEAFGERLLSAWDDAARGPKSRDIRNNVSGNVTGTIFQARDITGGLRF